MRKEHLERYFKSPEVKYRSVPFWSWNDYLDEKELHWQMKEMKDKGMGGAFMHSRIGLLPLSTAGCPIGPMPRHNF